MRHVSFSRGECIGEVTLVPDRLVLWSPRIVKRGEWRKRKHQEKSGSLKREEGEER